MRSIPLASATFALEATPSGTESLNISDHNYTVRLARSPMEVETALRLRHKVFGIELHNDKSAPGVSGGLDFDAFDIRCRHLIVVSNETGETVGTYRLNSIETAHSTPGFYSAHEFTIEDLPADVIKNGIEIGRACIARDHRNTRVLFLLWKALLSYLDQTGKRYFFGCCSIFSENAAIGRTAFRQLMRNGQLHDRFSVLPCTNGISLLDEDDDMSEVELPALFNMYLRLGARVCSPPVMDRQFGTIDFFVVFDIRKMNEKYRRMFNVT